MRIETIRQLAGWMSQAGLSSLEFKQDGFELRLVRPASQPALAANPPISDAPAAAPIAAAAKPEVAAMATLCGHFHARHPAREQPMVTPGQTVNVGDTVGVIAVGSLLLPVTVQHAGIAGDYLIEDGERVEYATPVLALAGE